jgi:uncharacterized protein (TIGR00290 family)
MCAEPARVALSWSGGKDAAWALHQLRTISGLQVSALVTTVVPEFGRVAMHGVRVELVAAQARAAELPLVEVPLPWPCSNDEYERRTLAALAALHDQHGVSHVAFGDLFLEDVRAFRERLLAGTGLTPIFPLWGKPTRALADEMLASGLEARVVCLDPRRVDRGLAGRQLDATLLDRLPEDVDPCGERGEFHTFVTAGPMFNTPVVVIPGEIVEREGFVYADLIPA